MTYEPTIRYSSAGYAEVTDAGKAKGVSVVWVNNARNAGSTYATDGFDYPWRVVWHEIQGGTNPSAIANHPYPPHVWYDAERRILYQTVPLSRGAFALYQAGDAPYLTNRARAIQIELAGYSDFVANEPLRWLDNISEDVLVPICQWVDSVGGSVDLNRIPEPWAIPGSAYTDAAQRFDPHVWATWPGTCAHANVPMGDDHWDTGALDIWRIASHAGMLIAGLLDEAGYSQQFKNQTEQEMPDLLYHIGKANTLEGTWYPVYRDGRMRSDVQWDEINFYLTVAKIPVHHSDNQPQLSRFMR